MSAAERPPITIAAVDLERLVEMARRGSECIGTEAGEPVWEIPELPWSDDQLCRDLVRTHGLRVLGL